MPKIIFSTAFFLFLNFALLAQDHFLKVLAEGALPAVHNFYVDLYDAAGNHSAIPVSIIKGKESGPVFTIVSGVHGFEYPPIISAQELIQELDPALLSGTVVVVPLANPGSFYSRTPFLNPQDNQNLNRVFPGNKNGSVTEKIADYITTTVIKHSDVFIDIHGGDANEDLLPFICYYNNGLMPKQTQKARTLTESSGFKYIVSYPYTLKESQAAKYAFKQAVQDEKVALSIECGKLGNVQDEAVDLIKSGVYNMLAKMGMYQTKKASDGDFIKINKQVYIKSKTQGFFSSDYSSGDQVDKGDVVGYIKDAFGGLISEVVASHSGVILYKIGTPPVNVDETLMCIGYAL